MFVCVMCVALLLRLDHHMKVHWLCAPCAHIIALQLQDKDASPADFARASMSIPVFFKPFRLPYETEEETINCKGETVRTKRQVGRLLDAGVRSDDWRERNGYSGVVPEEAMFCDGGMLSNFPMSLFHEDSVENRMPLLPTIGVQLSPAMVQMEAVDLTKGRGVLGSVVTTARYSMDRAFIRDNEAYRDTLAVSVSVSL